MGTALTDVAWSINFWKECYEKAQVAEQMLQQLPVCLQESENGGFQHSYGDNYILTLVGEEAFEMAYDCGVVFDKEWTFTGKFGTTKAGKDFAVMGRFSKDALYRLGFDDKLEIRVKVSALPKPETCQVVPVTEMVTRYVAQCNETEEEL